MDVEGIYKVIEKCDWKNPVFRGKNIQISCPLAPWETGHKSIFDKTPSLGIRVNENGTSLANCFACGFSGTLLHLVGRYQTLSKKDLSELIKYIKHREEVDVETIDIDIGAYEDKKQIYVEKILDGSIYAPMQGRTHQYILDRGLEIDTLKYFDCGFDATRQRVTFSVRNLDGKLVGIVGRAIKKHMFPKVYNYFEFDKGRYLFGEDRIIPNTIIIITEGPIDALLVWQELNKAELLEKYSVISMLGAEATKFQVKKLFKLTDEVICFLDNDPGGWTGQLRLMKLIRNKLVFRSVYYGNKYFGYDPAKLVNEKVDVVNMIEAANLII